MKENYLKIIERLDINIAATGEYFRTIILEDLTCGEQVDYNIYENRDESLWKLALNDDYHEMKIGGKIININVDKDLIAEATVNKEEGDYDICESFKMVVWDWPEWKKLPERSRIVISLKDQVWKLNRKYYQ